MEEPKEAEDAASHMTRKYHARTAVGLLGYIPFIVGMTLDPDTKKQPDPHAEALHEHFAHVAHCAFEAGRHFQIALGKEHEFDALRGEKVAGGARNSAHQSNARHEEMRAKRLARMEELISDGKTVKAAACICEMEGLGSWQTVRQTWYRYQEKGDS